MAILERRFKQVIPGKEMEALGLEAAFKAIEDRLGGFSPKRTYYPVAGPLPNNTLVWEREWESFAAAEAAYNRLMVEPELDDLALRGSAIYMGGEVTEFYYIV